MAARIKQIFFCTRSRRLSRLEGEKNERASRAEVAEKIRMSGDDRPQLRPPAAHKKNYVRPIGRHIHTRRVSCNEKKRDGRSRLEMNIAYGGRTRTRVRMREREGGRGGA